MEDVVEPGLYEHFKGPIYRVLGTALHTEHDKPEVDCGVERFVVYVGVTNEGGTERDAFFVRPLANFFEDVEHEGNTRPRFRRVQDGEEA